MNWKQTRKNSTSWKQNMHQLKNGMKKAKMQLAAKLLQNGSTIQYVADLTELPEETIRELAQNITSKKIL